jgi:hypothetical protein
LIHTVAIGLFILFTALPLMSLIDVQRQLPLRQLAVTMAQERQPTERLIMVGFPKPSLVFYTEMPIQYVVHTEDLATWLRRPQRLRRNSSTSVLILGLPRKLKELKLQPDEFTLLERSGAYELIRVKQPLER